MSWSGTVRCSHCYSKGHNRRSCPKITAIHLDRYKGYKDHRDMCVDNGDAPGVEMYEVRMQNERDSYVKRSGLDPDTGAKVKRKTAKAERMKQVTCGYCKGRGHTRRICPVVNADYQVYLVETKRVRTNLLVAVQEAGIGIGSMVTFPDRGYNAEGKWGSWAKLNYITTYMWSGVDAHSHGLSVRYVNHKNMHRMTDPHHIEMIAFDSLVERMKKVGEDAPTPSLTGSINPPDGWLDGGRSIKEAFPTQGTPSDKERPYDYRWPSDSKKEAITSLGLQEHYPDMDRS